jgi:nicotinate-nucleotide adenylyltransferase
MNFIRPSDPSGRSRRYAFYGGSFDPAHIGHLAIARGLIEQFRLDHFVFLPAFHAPHKRRSKPTSAYDRYAMLCLMTNEIEDTSVSRMEIELPERPYTFETLTRLLERLPAHEIYFVMGADSWMDITTWFKWEQVMLMTNHIVVTRPGFEISFDHVTDEIRKRVVDLRGGNVDEGKPESLKIFITDAVKMDISATSIRERIRIGDGSWRSDVTVEVANYIEKYQIYS